MMPRPTVLPILLLALAGCASSPPSPPPVVATPPAAPFEVQAYVPPPDEPDPPPAPPPVETSARIPGDGPRQADGRYRLSVAAFRQSSVADAWVQRAGQLGYRAIIETVSQDGATWYRVVLPGYTSKPDVLAALEKAKADFGAPDAWRLPNLEREPE